MLLLGPSTTKVCAQYLQKFECIISLITIFLEKFQKIWLIVLPYNISLLMKIVYQGVCSRVSSSYKIFSELNFQGNCLSGSLSNGIGNLSNLVKLDISSNLFSGVLPGIFMRVARLEQFSDTSNLFTGHLPTSLVNSPSLKC